MADTLSSELAKYGLNAKEAAETLAESIAKYRALGDGISGREKRLEQLNGEVMEAKRQLETLLSRCDEVKKDIEAKNKFLSDLKDGMMTKILEMKSDYKSERELEEQFSKKEAELDENIKQKKQELQSLIQKAEEEPKRSRRGGKRS